jgi:hypothetical protein
MKRLRSSCFLWIQKIANKKYKKCIYFSFVIFTWLISWWLETWFVRFSKKWLWSCSSSGVCACLGRRTSSTAANNPLLSPLYLANELLWNSLVGDTVTEIAVVVGDYAWTLDVILNLKIFLQMLYYLWTNVFLSQLLLLLRETFLACLRPINLIASWLLCLLSGVLMVEQGSIYGRS